ncbi:hypothetical protein AtubIFM55763_006888 [Aspergillus tubingensis]|uniref:Uncharacterized protein n=2 Tax=Aspergillus subgen. Circumdati TaxID=2720871 RepID=A0A9W6AT54_ASPTU|nr:similar to An15g02470 [Aspergillus niger]GLA75607.1 hypothetical protein AtubIFM55763_006888 [Aspergillus tubingensis]GLA86542.1 hypothetical protein AtubIFM56815_010810 [Aspergillus tubingensis]GLA93520.1 hypothetical protein AtubIFM57143_011117 [Aspergillus tubingensis]
MPTPTSPQQTVRPPRNNRNSQFSSPLPFLARLIVRLRNICSTNMASYTSLKEVIDRGKFESLSDERLVDLLYQQFEPVIDRLKNVEQNIEGDDAHPQGLLTRAGVQGKRDENDHNLTPSRYLFNGEDYSEVNRTLTNVLAVRWLLVGDYHTFTCHQKGPIKLKIETFNKFHDFIDQFRKVPGWLMALIVALVIGDVGKDDKLAKEVRAQVKTPSDEEMNHDTVLERALEMNIIESPSPLDLLPSPQRDDVIRGVRLGAKLNIPQLAQGENVPGSLQCLQDLRGQESAFDLKYLEIMFDVAGAGAHVDACGSVRMIEPVCQSFLLTYKILKRVISKEITIQEAYNEVLKNRGRILSDKGYPELSTDDKQDRALLRLYAMGRVADIDLAERFRKALLGLPDNHRAELIKELNQSGLEGEQAVILYYMPALFAELLRHTQQASEETQIKALTSLMDFMRRTYIGAKNVPGETNLIIECDVSGAKSKIQAPEFPEDLTGLNDYNLPSLGSKDSQFW